CRNQWPSTAKVLRLRKLLVPSLHRLCAEFCFEDDDYVNLFSPCKCRGTCAFVHQECINAWIKQSGSLQCEICQSSYEVESRRLKPFSQWSLPWNVSIGRVQMMRFWAALFFVCSSSVLLVLACFEDGHLLPYSKAFIRVILVSLYYSYQLFPMAVFFGLFQWSIVSGSENTVVKWKCNARNPIKK
uniref:RING-CH-type domain-containing protein n=1 Tax=Ditylenchus dipsaci TaxID=166011 RepID=A0A915EHE3_9BILA